MNKYACPKCGRYALSLYTVTATKSPVSLKTTCSDCGYSEVWINAEHVTRVQMDYDLPHHFPTLPPTK